MLHPTIYGFKIVEVSFRIGVYPAHDRMDLKGLQKQNQLHYLI